MEFRPFAKIGRLSRDMIVTEKLDGTNASVFVPEDDGPLLAGSRNRWVTPEADNYGFAAWVCDNATELRLLGPGVHFGEWWGRGIQRNYGLNERRFSLFNVGRWNEENKPACCHVVPVLGRHTFNTHVINIIMGDLGREGSRAAPGFMNPEGVIVFHNAAGTLFKKTFDKDDAHKGAD